MTRRQFYAGCGALGLIVGALFVLVFITLANQVRTETKVREIAREVAKPATPAQIQKAVERCTADPRCRARLQANALQGPRGLPGVGRQGPRGRRGRDGTDGKSIRGPRGFRGRTGATGSPGRDGRDGKDAVPPPPPPTVEEIRKIVEQEVRRIFCTVWPPACRPPKLKSRPPKR
jgi:hypothetical protein